MIQTSLIMTVQQKKGLLVLDHSWPTHLLPLPPFAINLVLYDMATNLSRVAGYSKSAAKIESLHCLVLGNIKSF